MANIVEIKDLSFEYGNKKIFDHLSLNITEGSFTTIIGPTGSGKSILARILVGLVDSKSDIKIDGQSVNDNNIKNIRKKIGYVLETVDNLFVCETVRENIIFTLKNSGYNELEIDIKLKYIIDALQIGHLLDTNPYKLSGGEKQLIALATIIAVAPKILIFDESMTIIDPKIRKKLFKLLKELNKKGVTIINFTQDSETLLEGNQIVVINNGNVVLNEKTKSAFDNVKLFTDNNIELPFIVDLSIKLQYYQTIDKIYFDSKKLVNDLWK